MGLVVGKTRCPKCAEKGRDRTGDNLVRYEDGGAICYSCGYVKYSKNWNKIKQDSEVEEELMDRTSNKIITKEENKELKSKTGVCNYRGVRADTWKRLGVRFVFDQETGTPIRQYYPNTLDGKLSGYKRRDLPKKFGAPLGETGAVCDLYGSGPAFRKPNQKQLIIVGGEVDQASVSQVLYDYTKKRGYKHPNMLVVSPSVGESCKKQIKYNHKMLAEYDEVFIGFDMDDAGKKATEDVVKVLPRVKVRIIEWTKKDPNEMLQAGLDGEIISCIYNAKVHTSTSIAGSSTLMTSLAEEIRKIMIPLPPFMKKLSSLMCGGIPLGSIINIGAMCVDADTEFFTGKGWKRISEYAEGDKVGQWSNGSLEVVSPTRYVKEPCKKLTRMANTRMDMVLSDEHRVVYFDEHNLSNQKEIRFKDLKDKHLNNTRGFRGKVDTAFSYCGEGLDISEGELRLQVAVIADGRVVKGGKNNYTQMRFKKKDKYQRLLNICKDWGLPVCDKSVGNTYELIVWPKWSDKDYDSKYYSASTDQMQVILDEMVYWDGYKARRSFTSTKKSSVDFIQFAFASLGIRSSISIDKRAYKYAGGYCATVTPSKQRFAGFTGGSSSGKVEFEDFETDGFKYCFEVPSSYLVFRRNGKIFVTGNSGIGKTSIVNEVIYYLLFNSPYKVGILSMELNKGQYAEVLLSRHIGKKIALIGSTQDKVNFLEDPEVQEAASELFTENGEDRFFLMDERDGSVKDVMKLVEEMIINCDCRVVVLDPLQDILDGLSNEEQAVFLKWQKTMVGKYNTTFINISHLRKNNNSIQPEDTGLDILHGINEQDFQGTSAIFKSGSANILFARNKRNEDPIEKNTTYVMLDKCRWSGYSGFAGDWFYELETHTMHDKQEYMENVA